MASDFDQLVEHLQYELALRSTEGFSFLELEERIRAFYDVKYQAASAQEQPKEEDLLFSEEPPATRTVITNDFVKTTWNLLAKLKDITASTHDDIAQPEERLRATTDCLWLELAGHSEDVTRIKPAEFVLLHIIAKRGPPGIPQPELVRESGQDKRSVPQRTDNLAKRGYITKTPVISGGFKTSLLKLKRFSIDEGVDEQIIFYERWFNEVIRILKANNGVVGIEDIRTELATGKNNSQVKALQRCLRRLEANGCVRRIKARVAGKEEGDKGLFMKCIKQVREPNDTDRKLFAMQPAEWNRFLKKKGKSESSKIAGEDGEEDESDDEVEFDDTISIARRRDPPQWTPGQPLASFIYDLVKTGGPQGLNIMEIHRRGVGPLWRRPMDESLIRLCDRWQTSQPPHLRHLTLMKDTMALNKYTFFNYRTYENFVKAVENGDALWEAVQYKDPSKKGKKATALPEANLDAYGFPVLSKALFAGSGDGTATLEQCAQVAMSDSNWVLDGDDELDEDAPMEDVADFAQGSAFVPHYGAFAFKPKPAIMGSSIPESSMPVSDDASADPSRQGSLLAEPSVVVPHAKEESVIPPLRKGRNGLGGLSLLVSVNSNRAVRTYDAAMGTEKQGKKLLITFRHRFLRIPGWLANAPRRYDRQTAAALSADGGSSVLDGPGPASSGTLDDSLRPAMLDPRLFEQSFAVATTNDPAPFASVNRTCGAIQPYHDSPTLAGASRAREFPASSSTSHNEQDTLMTADTVGGSPEQPSPSSHAAPDTSASPPRKRLKIGPLAVPSIAAAESGSRTVVRKTGISRGSGTVQIKRAQVIMDIIQLCGGIYPGNKEIYHPVAAALKRIRSGVVDSVTIDNSIKDLLHRKKLNRMIFSWNDRTGMQIERSILTEPDMTPDDPRVQELQRNMIYAHPYRYHPPQAEIPASMRASLDTKIANMHARDPDEPMADDPLETDAKDDAFPLEEDVVVQRTAAGLEAQKETEQESMKKKDKAKETENKKEKKEAKQKKQKEKEPRPKRVKQALLWTLSDEELSEEEPEQLEMMGEFQATDYSHDNSHAFVAKKPRSRTAKKTSAASFFATTPPPTTINTTRKRKRTTRTDSDAPQSRARQLSASLTNASQTPRVSDLVQKGDLDESYLDEMQVRAMHLMMAPNKLYHATSGTIGTAAVVHDANDASGLSASMGFEAFQKSLSASDPFAQDESTTAVRKPFVRLQSLGTGLLAYERFRNFALFSRQFGKTPELSQSLNVDGLKRKYEAISLASNAEDSQLKNKKKKTTTPYKTMRSTRKALGLDPDTRSAVEPAFHFEVQGPRYAMQTQRDRKGPAAFNDWEQLGAAITLCRVIFGGMDQRINWSVVRHMMDFKYDPDFLRRRWDGIRNASEDKVRAVMERTYEPFLRDYQAGKLPRIDFSHPRRNNWQALLAWFEETVGYDEIDPEGDCFEDIPANVSDFHEDFAVDLPPTLWEHSREAWFTSPVEKFRKDLCHLFVYGSALPGHRRPIDTFHDQKIVVKSWIRAVAATNPQNWNPDFTSAKMRAFPQAVVTAACDELLTSKTIRHLYKRQHLRGRNFEMHDAQWAVFRRWPGKEIEWQYVREIVKARHLVLDRIKEKGTFYVDYHADDCVVVVLLNMTDQGLIKIGMDLPERNDSFDAPFPKLTAWGYSDYTYNAKTLDRGRLRFPVVFEPTEKFTLEHGLTAGVPIPISPRAANDDGRIPFWIDINDNLIPEVWDLTLRSVLHMIVFRTGCTTSHIEEGHGHRILAWEIDLAIDWMVKAGVVERCGVGRVIKGAWQGGWKASEWWYCMFEPDVAYWSATWYYVPQQRLLEGELEDLQEEAEGELDDEQPEEDPEEEPGDDADAEEEGEL